MTSTQAKALETHLFFQYLEQDIWYGNNTDVETIANQAAAAVNRYLNQRQLALPLKHRTTTK